MNRDAYLQRLWYQRRPRWLLLVLLPLSALFALIVLVRRHAYRMGLLPTERVDRPVIVVGNISVGGTGKTPLVIWLTVLLQARGQRVGIVTRGYGGQGSRWPREVTAATPPAEVGDEPVMMAQRTGAIVIAGPERAAAAKLAIDKGADVIVCDDGLQHYGLHRDGEIAVIDSQRRMGNGLLLPAGPLREPVARLESVDLIVFTQRTASAQSSTQAATASGVTARLRLVDAVAVRDSAEHRALDTFRDQPIHAVAAIGNPQAFFSALRQQGLLIHEHALPDHASLSVQDISFGDDAAVLMTEKDAVKCRAFADRRHWAVRLDLELSERDMTSVTAFIDAAIQRFRARS